MNTRRSSARVVVDSDPLVVDVVAGTEGLVVDEEEEEVVEEGDDDGAGTCVVVV